MLIRLLLLGRSIIVQLIDFLGKFYPILRHTNSVRPFVNQIWTIANGLIPAV